MFPNVISVTHFSPTVVPAWTHLCDVTSTYSTSNCDLNADSNTIHVVIMKCRVKDWKKVDDWAVIWQPWTSKCIVYFLAAGFQQERTSECYSVHLIHTAVLTLASRASVKFNYNLQK